MSDIWTQVAHYRKVTTLPDGSRLLLRPLEQQDKENLLALFAGASEQDLEYFRSDASDPEVVAGWVEHLNLKDVFPLVAVIDDRIVGDATLHFGEHYNRHIAWVRIFLAQDYRRQGIGTLMLRNLIKIAQLLGLQQLHAEVLATQHQVIKAFEELGFKYEATLSDYFMTNEGETSDVVLLVQHLASPSGEF
jgi:RimJ/RimL family protein N-acetyltransferase